MARRDSDAWLVVGGDGLIGRALVRRLEADGRAVLATTRRRGCTGPRRPHLELAQDPSDWIPPEPVSVAFLLAAAANQLSCCADPAAARRINVDNTVALARRLLSLGAFVVFTSTNLVFDGEQARYPVFAEPRPTSEYGRQKAEAERALLALGSRVAVVRLTKVLAAELPLIGGWVEALKAGRPVEAFTDLVCAPMPVNFVAEALARIGARGKGGLFHLSGADEVNYADLAVAFARRLGADPSLVRPVASAEAGVRLQAIPRHSSLDASGSEGALGLAPPPIEAVLRSCIGP
ncbi:MAG TPA: sugar nucleotide-binding protein [Alphaproteobacteria bacterium]|nr:sugar nucleotide-binding protein [Alphaproteobacteria bacterium]